MHNRDWNTVHHRHSSGHQVPEECPHKSTLQVRGYAVYSRLEEKAKAMVLALPLVQDLHHPAMRDRHWALLQKVSGQGGQMHGMTG